jgi:hypothetical protein
VKRGVGIPMTIVPGVEGFSLITYTGKAKSPKQWPGPVTGVSYTLGGDITIALVDSRDAVLFSTKIFEVVDAKFAIDTADDPLLPVSILSICGASVLVRRPDVLACCYVPRFTIDTGPFTLKRVKDPRVALSILNIAIPYGENWESVFQPIEFDPVRFNHDLKMAGVWTTNDFRARPNTIHRIIDQMLGLSGAVAIASKSQGG